MANELHKKSVGDLHKLLIEKEQALRTFYFGITGSKVKNVKEGRGIRKEIAQIKTIIREKQNEVTK